MRGTPGTAHLRTAPGMDSGTGQESEAVTHLWRPRCHGQRASASERTGSMRVSRVVTDTHHVSVDLISKDGDALS